MNRTIQKRNSASHSPIARLKSPPRFASFIFHLLFAAVFIFSTAAFTYKGDHAQPGKTLRVGVYNFKPLIFMDENGSAQGLYIDVLNHIAQEEHWTLEYVPCAWVDCLAAAAAGELDILPSIGYTEERARKLDYTRDFLFLDWGVIYRNHNQTIETALDLEGKRIAALKGSIYTEGLNKLLDQFGIHAEIIEKNEYTEVLAAVNSGEADAGVITKVYGLELETDYARIQQTDIFFSPVKLYFALPKDKDPGLLAALNKHFAALKADRNSYYYQSLDKWMGFHQKDAALPQWAVWSLLGLGTLLGAAFLFSLTLRHQVSARTRALEMEVQERKQAEKALAEQQFLLQTYLDNLPALFFVKDLTGKIVSVNQTFERVFQISAQSLIGKTDYDLHPAEEAAATFANDQWVAQTGKTLQIEEPTPLPDGEHIFLSTKFPIRNVNAEIVGTAGISLDVTERKRAEQALQTSEQKLREIFNNANDAIYLMGLGADGLPGKFTEVNDVACKMLGYSREEFLNMSPVNINAEDIREKLPKMLKPLLSQGRMLTEATLRSKDGRNIPVEISSRLVEIMGQRKILSVARDVTERKLAEANLLKNKALLSETEKTGKIGGWEFDVKTMTQTWTEETFRILEIDLTHGEPKVPEGVDFIAPAFRPMALEAIQKAIENGEPYDQEWEIITAKGNKRWVHSVARPRRELDRTVSVSGSFQDITARKRAEEALKTSLAETRQRQMEVEALLTGARAVLENDDFKVTARHIFDSCKTLVGATAGYVALLNPDGHENEVVFLDPGKNNCAVDPSLPMPIRGLRGEAYRTGRAVFDNDFEHSEWIQFIPQGHAALENVMFAPLVIEGVARGLLGLANKPGGFTENDARMATAFGEIASIALRNSWMVNQLRESEDRYRRLADNGPDTIFRYALRPAPRLEYINPVVEKVTGYTPEECYADPRLMFNMAHPEDIPVMAELMQSPNFDKPLVMRWIGKDNVTRWMESRVVPVYDEKSELTAVEGITRDITERRQMEEALRESEANLSALIENTDGSIWAVNGQYGLIVGNEEFHRNISAVIGRKFNMGESVLAPAIPPEANAEWQGYYDRALRGESFSIEMPTRFRPAPLQIEYRFSPIRNVAGEIHGVTVYGRDVTERKQAEEEVLRLNASLEQRVEERTQELLDAQEKLVRQEKLAVLGQMAGSVSHELRNPLGVIANAIYFLKMVQTDAPDKVKEYLNLIEKNVHVSEKIIADLLDFTRVKSAAREPISVPDLIRQTLERFPAPEQVQVTLELPADLPKMYADPQHVIQVLGNLTLNACQAMPQGGTLVISSRIQDEMICIAVQDNGAGIPPENLKKLFEPLFTTKAKGIGLGLAVCQKLADANGGRIEVQSEEGAGSTFTLYVPIRRS